MEAAGEGWTRRLELFHDGEGSWRSEAEEEGEAGLPAGGGDVEALAGALDCDLGFSPVTNLMPIRRHALHERPGDVDFLVAWVSVPDLGLHPSQQRYGQVRAGSWGAAVRYLDRAGAARLPGSPARSAHGSATSEIHFISSRS